MSKRQPPSPDNPNRPNTKRTGERSEAAFLYQASQRRFAISKPWGDSERYDFILDNRPQPQVHLFRIQIKCTDCLRAGAYETRATYTVGKRRAVYTKRDIDFIAAHVVPLNIWYIIPVEVCTPQPMLRFYPHRQAKKMRLEKYREAWHLLDPPLTIQACIDPDYADDAEACDYADGDHVEGSDSTVP
jgi:PD-(D/E)XK endonuclease